MSNSKLRKKWEAVRDDLGLDVSAPYDVFLNESVRIRAEVFVRYFGGEKGTLIFTEKSLFWRYHEDLAKLGYGASVFEEPKDTSNYDRETFVHMLSEWGWTGDDADRPKWIREVSEE